MLVVCFIH